MMTINLEDKLVAANRRFIEKEDKILAEQQLLNKEGEKLTIERVLQKADNEVEKERVSLLAELGFNYHHAEAVKVLHRRSAHPHLPRERIFTFEAIRELCLKYNLRFLPTSYYQGSQDRGLVEKVEEFRKLMPKVTKVASYAYEVVAGILRPTGWNEEVEVPATLEKDRFHIAAPVSSFKLEPKPKDPLLFYNLGGDDYYLVHKWGNDLSWFRRWKKAVLFTACPIAALLATSNAVLTWCSPGAGPSEDFFFGLLAMAVCALGIFLIGTSTFTTRQNWNRTLLGLTKSCVLTFF